MRILTVRQPWAWAIIHGGKDVENRVRNIAGGYRGPIAIHAALAWDVTASWNAAWPELSDALDRAGETVWDAPEGARGAIIGVVDLVDVHHADWCWDGPGVHCSPWADTDAHHLVLANPRALDEPFPYKGALGLRRLDDEIIARIREAIA